MGKDEKTKSLVDDLNKLFSSEQRFVLAVTYATTQSIKSTVDGYDVKLDQIDASVGKVSSKIVEIEDKERLAQVENILRQVLCSTSVLDDVEETFATNKRRLVKGTGAWIRHEVFFIAWIEDHASILWIFGGPGVGKSHLSTWIVQELPTQKPKGTTFAYFFVKEHNQVLRDANIILQTLAWQLAKQDSELRQHAAEVCQERIRTITAEVSIPLSLGCPIQVERRDVPDVSSKP